MNPAREQSERALVLSRSHGRHKAAQPGTPRNPSPERRSCPSRFTDVGRGWRRGRVAVVLPRRPVQMVEAALLPPVCRTGSGRCAPGLRTVRLASARGSKPGGNDGSFMAFFMKYFNSLLQSWVQFGRLPLTLEFWQSFGRTLQPWAAAPPGERDEGDSS